MTELIKTSEHLHNPEKLLEGKVAVISGATRGIGLEIAKAFGKHGAAIVGIGRDKAHYESMQPYFDEQSIPYSFFQADVTDVDRLEQIAVEIGNLCGKVDVLVNNAGSANVRAGIKDMTVEEWRSVIDGNLNSVFYFTHYILPLMLRKQPEQDASIINISSIAARMGTAKSAYTTAKAGMLGLTKSMALSLAADNIRVNAIAPGAVDTDLTSGWNEAQRLDIAKKIPLAHIAKPDEIADVALFLASPLSRYMTGQTLDVNGGWVMP